MNNVQCTMEMVMNYEYVDLESELVRTLVTATVTQGVLQPLWKRYFSFLVQVSLPHARKLWGELRFRYGRITEADSNAKGVFLHRYYKIQYVQCTYIYWSVKFFNENDIDSPINGLFKEILAQEPFIFELIVQIFNNTI